MGIPNRRRTAYLRVALRAKRAEAYAFEREEDREDDPNTRRELVRLLARRGKRFAKISEERRPAHQVEQTTTCEFGNCDRPAYHDCVVCRREMCDQHVDRHYTGEFYCLANTENVNGPEAPPYNRECEEIFIAREEAYVKNRHEIDRGEHQ